MATISGVIVRARQGDTVDKLVFARYGKTDGIVATVLDLNPGLAAIGMILPLGTEVFMPTIVTQDLVKPTITLWS